MSKSPSMTLLLGLVLLGAYIVSKSKKDALEGVDVIGTSKPYDGVKVPKGYHLMPDGSLMKNEEHGKSSLQPELEPTLPETYDFGGFNSAVSF